MKTSAKRWLWGILLLTLVLKIIVVLVSGPSYNLHSDDESYVTTAKIWLETGEFTYNDPERPTVFITPALPAFIALFMKFLGSGMALLQTLRIVQVVMVTAGLYLLFLIGKKLFSEKVALVAVGISAFYIPLWLMSNLILTEAMFVLALMLLIYAALRTMEEQSVKWSVLFGLAWAFAIYVRPTIALWPGLLFLLLMYWRTIPWARLLKCGLVVGLVLVLCLLPWWIRNYEVTGQFIALTKSGGNPLLLGTYPWYLPSLEEQRTWHATNNLWLNDQMDTQKAYERIKEGFSNDFIGYLEWYTVGKFFKFWGDVFYWLPVAGISSKIVWSYHYIVVLLGFVGMWFARRNKGAVTLVLLCGYMTILHMIYLAHGRYSAPLVPLVALFAAYLLVGRRTEKREA